MLAFHLLALPAHALAGRAALVPGGWRGLAAGLAALGTALVVLGLFLGGNVFGVFRLWGLGLFVHVPAALCAWSLLSRRDGHERRLPLAAPLGAATLLAAMAVYAYGIEPVWLEVTRPVIASPKLREQLTVAVLADVQTDEISAYEESVVERVVAERPDLVLLTGDYLHAPPAVLEREAPRFRALMMRLRAPLGAYAVGGNVDPPDWPRLFEGTPVVTLASVRTLDLGPLSITGLPLNASMRGASVPARAGFHVVFGHAPDFALGDLPADLLVAGHTHGGQVRLPGIGPLLTFSRVPRAWASGVTSLGAGRTLVVSRGVGMERGRAPRLRFLCRPELIFLQLTPQGSAP